VDLTITNETGVDVTSWQVVMTFSDGSVVTGGNVTVISPGPPSTTVGNVGFNSDIDAGDSITVFVAGSGSGDLVSITGDLCGPAVASEGLTVEKTIASDNGGTATLDDFDISVNDGTGSSEVAWATPTSTTNGSEIVSTVAGTFTLSEIDFPNYTEGVWSCTDDSDGSIVSVTNGGLFSGADVVVASGQAVTCSITNDDDAVVISLPLETPPTVCSAEHVTNQFQQAAQWLSADFTSGGTITAFGSTLLANPSSFIPGPGVSVNTSSTTTVITGATEPNFSSAYMAGDYIDYPIETLVSFPSTTVLSGLVEFGGRDGTAPYQMDVLVSDDDFVTAVRVLSNYVVDTPGSFEFISSGLEQIYLDSGTEYKFRVVYYDANPSGANILMDDFALVALLQMPRLVCRMMIMRVVM